MKIPTFKIFKIIERFENKSSKLIFTVKNEFTIKYVSSQKFNELKNFECLNFHGFSGFFKSFDFLDKLKKIHVVI